MDFRPQFEETITELIALVRNSCASRFAGPLKIKVAIFKCLWYGEKKSQNVWTWSARPTVFVIQCNVHLLLFISLILVSVGKWKRVHQFLSNEFLILSSLAPSTLSHWTNLNFKQKNIPLNFQSTKGALFEYSNWNRFFFFWEKTAVCVERHLSHFSNSFPTRHIFL